MVKGKGQADRSKAARLRAKSRRTAAEERWLSVYDASKTPGARIATPRAPQEAPPVEAPRVTLDELAPVAQSEIAAVPVLAELAAAEGEAAPPPAGAVVGAEQPAAVAPVDNQVAAMIAGLAHMGLEAAAEVAAARRGAGKAVSPIYLLAAQHRVKAVAAVYGAAHRVTSKWGVAGSIPLGDELVCAAAIGGSVFMMLSKDELIAAGDEVEPVAAPAPAARAVPPAPAQLQVKRRTSGDLEVEP